MTGVSPGWELAAGVKSEKEKTAESWEPPEAGRRCPRCLWWAEWSCSHSPGQCCWAFCALHKVQKGEENLTPWISVWEVPCAENGVLKSDLLVLIFLVVGRQIKKKKRRKNEVGDWQICLWSVTLLADQWILN